MAMSRLVLGLSPVFLLLTFACSSDGDGAGDGGIVEDAAMTIVDAAGSGMDATPADARVDASLDGGVPDTGILPVDGGVACQAAYAGCSSYMDMTGTATVTIGFGGGLGNSYAPKCIQIAAGTNVVFSGSFSSHPLRQGCGPASPIVNGTGTSTTFTFSNAGDFGYYCTAHATANGSGMAGSIRVVP